MGRIWHIGNTTIRNPIRIADGLSVFHKSQFHGNLDSKEDESGFAYALRDAGVINIGKETSDVSSHGRKWRACFSQLGFITFKPKRETKEIFKKAIEKGEFLSINPDNYYEITPNGKRLIESDNVLYQQEAMLRALLAYELPSIIEDGYDFNVFKPFVFILQLLKSLKDKEEKGLAKFEFAIVTMYDSHGDVEKAVENILDYRQKRKVFNGNLKSFDKKYLDELLPNADENTKRNASVEYPDLIMRYSRFTGLLQLDGRRITLNENKQELINMILLIEPIVVSEISQVDYLIKLWNGAKLPTDNVDVKKNQVIKFLNLLDRTDEISEVNLKSEDEINALRYELEEEHNKLREIKYANKQSEEIEDIIYYLKELTKSKPSKEAGIYDKPAFLEWALWRTFLAVNNLVNMPYEARRFKVDNDFYPLRCAAGGGPDMIFEFEDYILVVEVTLTTSSRQEAAEGESVRRHVAKVDIEGNVNNKSVYGLFIANSIDNNTAEVFRIGIWYQKDEPNFLNIVPITIKQLISILEQFDNGKVNKDVIRSILDACLIPRNTYAPKWKEEIDLIVSRFA